MEEVGDVSVLVNNAGLVHGKTVMNSTIESIEETINVNVLAQFWVRRNFGLSASQFSCEKKFFSLTLVVVFAPITFILSGFFSDGESVLAVHVEI